MHTSKEKYRRGPLSLNIFLPILSGTRKFSWHSDALWQDQILKQGSLVEMFPDQFVRDHA